MTGRKDRKMAWYDGTFSCGHKGSVDICGPTKDRQRKAEYRFSGLCPECYKVYLQEEKEKKNKEAAEKSAEMELPRLDGSEKQVAWANSIRLNIVEELYKKMETLEKVLKEKGLEVIPKTNLGVNEVSNALDYFIQSHTEAKYWIDIRQCGITFNAIVQNYEQYINDLAHDDVLEEIEQEKSVLIVKPISQESSKNGVVKIEFDSSDSILVKYVKDEDFINIMKNQRYKWNGTAWVRKITEFTGSALDRIAEIGNALLNNGFTVQFPDNETKDTAIDGNYQLENDRWVKYNAEIDKIEITWKTRSDTLYNSCRKIPSAKWRNGCMLVSPEFYKDVEDFAETMGFAISQAAKNKIHQYKKAESIYEKANPIMPKIENISDKERIAKALKSSGTILEDLID